MTEVSSFLHLYTRIHTYTHIPEHTYLATIITAPLQHMLALIHLSLSLSPPLCLLFVWLSLSFLALADRHSMPIRHSALAPASPTRHLQFLNPTPPSQENPYSLADEEGAGWGANSSPKLSLLASPQRGKFGSFSSRAPSPGGYRSEKMSILRKRAESFDSHTGRTTRKPGLHWPFFIIQCQRNLPIVFGSMFFFFCKETAFFQT